MLVTFLIWQRSIQKLFLPPRSVARNQGWTLIEMAVVSVIVGILTALFIPNMLGMSRKNELQATANQVKGALREAQRAAIRNGSSCTVTISSTSPQISGSPAGCITSPVTLNSSAGISLSATMDSGGTPTSISSLSFSYKGNPSNSGDVTIVLSSTSVSEGRCIVISTGIGIMRSGTYSGTTCTSTL